MLAPQRGLFATVESKSYRNSHVMRAAQAMRTETAEGILRELSNFGCLSGRAGGSPDCNSLAAALVLGLGCGPCCICLLDVIGYQIM